MKHEMRVRSVVVVPEGEPIFSELATVVEIDDEAAGEFVEVFQPGGAAGDNKIRISPEEWGKLKSAIDCMIDRCRPHKEKEPSDAPAN